MRLATAVGLVVLIAVAALLWLRRAAPVGTAPAAQPDPSQRDARAASGAAASGGGGSKAVAKADLPSAAPAVQPARADPDPADAERQRRALEQEKLAGLSAAGHDPPGNAGDLAFFRRTQRIDSLYDGHTAMLRALGEQHPQPVRTRAGSDPVLTAWTDVPRAFPGSRVRLHVELGGSAPPEVSTLRAFLSLRGLPQELELRPDGPLQWTAEVAVPADLPVQPTQLLAVVQVTAAGIQNGAPFEMSGGTGFTINFVDGRLVRLERPRIQDGNLILDAILDVQLGGRWYVYAELKGPAGEPVASARDRVALQPGEARVPLVFGGQALREQRVDGPYTVHLARATRVEELPPNETNPLLDVLTTPAWLATEFH
jgi:hypothetical protein